MEKESNKKKKQVPLQSSPKEFWNEMTSLQIARAQTNNWIAILPVAATEQHGPHLPLGTDALLAKGLIELAAQHIPKELPVTFLPIQEIGKSEEHENFAGSLSLPADLLCKSWEKIGLDLYKSGIKKLLILSSHGGNVPAHDIVIRELRRQYNMLAIATSWQRFGLPEGIFKEEEKEYGIHGGDYETSLMLHFRPDLVDMGQAEDFTSKQQDYIKSYKLLRAHGKIQYGWMSEDLNPKGVLGNAALAKAEKGQKLAQYWVDNLIQLLHEIHDFKSEFL